MAHPAREPQRVSARAEEILHFGRLARKMLAGTNPFKRNLPTDKQFLPPAACDFAREQAQLVGLVQRLGQAGPGGLTLDAHPFFGPLSAEEWDALMWKHLDHHLQQFGG